MSGRATWQINTCMKEEDGGLWRNSEKACGDEKHAQNLGSVWKKNRKKREMLHFPQPEKLHDMKEVLIGVAWGQGWALGWPNLFKSISAKLINNLFFIMLYLNIHYLYFMSMGKCMHIFMCTIHGAWCHRGVLQWPWNSGYRWLWTTRWVLGTKSVPLGKAATVFNCWAFALAFPPPTILGDFIMFIYIAW